MALKDLIVPKWKHSRVEVRLAAIDTISNDLKIIREIAETDLSPQVRIAAIKKIEDEQLLGTIIQFEKDEQVLETARKQRESFLKRVIATSNDQQAVISALEKYGNEKAIASYLCDHNPDIAVQRKLFHLIKSHQLLAKITEHECASEIAEEIVLQITEKEYLERIAQRASNKKIRTIAQDKIDKLFADPHAEEREITRKLKLCCTGLDIQVSPKNYSQAIELLEISRNIWNKYDPQRQHSLAVSYAAAEKVLTDRIEHAEAQKIVLEMLENICLKVELLTQEPDVSLEEHFEHLQMQWNTVDRTIIQDLLTVSLDDRFKTVCTKIASAIKASKEAREQVRRNKELLEQACGELELFADSSAAPDERAWQRLLAHWDTLCSKHTPDEVLKRRFIDAGKRYREKIDAKVQLEKSEQQDEIEYVERLVMEMESIAQTAPQYARSRYLQAVRLKKEWDKSWPMASVRKAALQSTFANAYESFMAMYHELQEQSSWQHWANEHVKTKMLDDFEGLENTIKQGESLKKIARKLSLFESQWRRASGGERETKELNDRFSAIRDRIFSLALAKKTELLETLKTVLAQSEESNQTEEIKSLQKQWNDIGYLPPELENDLPDTFYGLCNGYFEQRKEQYQKYSEEIEKNIKIREEICTDAEKHSGSTDWKAAKDVFTQLQNRWDESWPAPHKKSQELWLQFSKNRDLFFERYHAFQTENDKRKEELCTEAERLLARLSVEEPVLTDEETETEIVASGPDFENGSTGEAESETTVNEPSTETGAGEMVSVPKVNYGGILNAAIKLQKSWKENGPGSKERSEELWERFNGTLRNVYTIIDEEHRKNFELKETLVKEAESIALSDDWDCASARFQEIRDTWKSVGQAARRDEQVLWKRLQAAADTFFGRRRTHFDSKRKMVRQSIEEKEQLIAELEIMVRIAGKSHLLKTSQNQSAAEILKKGIDLRNQLVVDGDQEKTYNNIKKRALEIIDIWEDGEQLRGKDFYELDKRFDELLEILKRR
jgi:hypothetical protein